MTDDWPLSRLLSAVVGSGPKSAADMTRAQAREAMGRILDREPDPTTLGAFLLANRWKRNTPEELAGFLDVVVERTVERAAPAADPVDCGANYDGKRDTALLGVAAGVVSAAAGAPVVTHSADRVPTKRGATYRHVLSALGVETDLAPDESAAMVDETGFGFYYQPRFSPGVHALLDRREAMGVRTFLNSIETLVNPADAPVHLGSFYHLAFARKLAGTLDAAESWTGERAVFVQGLEGYDDVRPGSTKVAEWDGDDLSDFDIETAAYGMDADEAALSVEDVAADSAEIAEDVLSGERTDHFADAVRLNAALRLYAGGDAADLDEGLETAAKTIDDGTAATVLSELRAFEPARAATAEDR